MSLAGSLFEIAESERIASVAGLQSQVGLVLVLVLPGHEGHDQHVEEHQPGEEEEGVGLEKRSL